MNSSSAQSKAGPLDLERRLGRKAHALVEDIEKLRMICPPITAYRLHKLLPQSRLIIVERAGHSASEPGIQAALIKAMKELGPEIELNTSE